MDVKPDTTTESRTRLRNKSITAEVVSVPEPAKRKKSRKEISADYRSRLKENSELLQAHREHEKIRFQNYYARRSEEAIQRNREKQRERQRQYRERKKAQQEIQPKAPKTRKASDEDKKMCREAKRIQRENMSSQKKVAVNKKRREEYARKKSKTEAAKQSPIVSTSSSSTMPSEPRSSTAQRVANCRFKKKLAECLPSGAHVRAEVLAAGIQALSPGSKQAVNSRLGITSPNSKRRLAFNTLIASSFKDHLQQLSLRRNIKDLRLKRVLAKAVTVRNKAAADYFGVSRKMRQKITHYSSESGWEDHRKKRKDAVTDEMRSEIVTFLNSQEISRDLPDARSACVKKGEIISRKVLVSSMKTTFQKYTDEYGPKVSFSFFKRCRPQSVLPFTSHRYNECLCEYCENVDLKLKSLNACLPQHLRLTDRYHASRLTLCPKENGEYKRKCLDRQCEICGVDNLTDHLQPALLTDRATPVVYWQWQQMPIGHGKTRLTKVMQKEKTLENLIEALRKDLITFSVHLFNARWQAAAYKDISTKCPANVCP